MSSNTHTINVSNLITVLQGASDKVQSELSTISGASGTETTETTETTVSISDMFNLQFLTNKLSQLSEMSSSVVSAMHNSLMSLARSVKQ